MTAVLDHIVLCCHDVEVMLDFYTKTLELEPHRVDAWRSGDVPFPCVRVHAETLIDLLPKAMWAADDRPDAPSAGRAGVLHHFCLALAQDDWERIVSRLRDAGRPLVGPMTLSGARGEGTSVYTEDPEGNSVELRYY